MEETFLRIMEWNDKRNLLNTPFNIGTEAAMLDEELDEFVGSISITNPEERNHAVIDALADIIVVAAGGIVKLGYNPTKVMSECLSEIETRIGAINKQTGKFEKDRSQEARDAYYTADYTTCKL